MHFLNSYGGKKIKIREDKIYRYMRFIIDEPDIETTLDKPLTPVVRMSHVDIIGTDFRIGRCYCKICYRVYNTPNKYQKKQCPKCFVASGPYTNLIEFVKGSVLPEGLNEIVDEVIDECFNITGAPV